MHLASQNNISASRFFVKTQVCSTLFREMCKILHRGTMYIRLYIYNVEYWYRISFIIRVWSTTIPNIQARALFIKAYVVARFYLCVWSNKGKGKPFAHTKFTFKDIKHFVQKNYNVCKGTHTHRYKENI